MSLWCDLFAWAPLLLAEAADGNADAQPPGGSFADMLPLLLGMGLLFYLIVLRPQQKERRQHQDRVQSLTKNRKIVTAGGIHGVVMKVDTEQRFATIRIDEATGATMRISLDAITRIVDDDANKETAAKNKSKS